MHKLQALLSPLRVFDALYRTGSVRKAAEVLHVTPGAVSQRLKQLEVLMDTPLFNRNGRDLQYTPAAEQLARRIGELFDRIETAVQETRRDPQGPKLRLKLIPSFAIRWLVPRLASFYAIHPEIELELATVARMEEVSMGQADFIIRHGDGNWPDFHFDHIFDDAFVPVCSQAMAEKISRPSDLLKVNLLHSMMRPGDWDIWMQSAGITEAVPRGGTSLGNAALCYQAAADGLGVAIAQLAYVSEDLRMGKLVTAVDHVARTDSGYYLLCELSKADSYPHRAFRDWIRQVR
jgi:DNA-binding transcriptional LysR family regulator